jgi:DNA segregation ATPase FtsK/SpoIIIE-like protein
MPNYNNSKIYKIVSPSNPDLIYYGSTTQTLSSRMAEHRHRPDKTKTGLITCYDDAIILLVENFSCNSKEELHKKEGEYILNNDCVNKCVAGRTRKEYKEANKEKIKNNNKTYYEDNKERILLKTKQYKEANREKILLQKKKYRNNNKEKQKQYYEDNKEHIIKTQKEYRDKRGY